MPQDAPSPRPVDAFPAAALATAAAATKARLFDRLDAVEEARRLELDPAVFAALEAALDAVASIAARAAAAEAAEAAPS